MAPLGYADMPVRVRDGRMSEAAVATVIELITRLDRPAGAEAARLFGRWHSTLRRSIVMSERGAAVETRGPLLQGWSPARAAKGHPASNRCVQRWRRR